MTRQIQWGRRLAAILFRVRGSKWSAVTNFCALVELKFHPAEARIAARGRGWFPQFGNHIPSVLQTPGAETARLQPTLAGSHSNEDGFALLDCPVVPASAEFPVQPNAPIPPRGTFDHHQPALARVLRAIRSEQSSRPMNIIPHPIRARLLGVALACMALLGSPGSAQSTATGSIEGRVQDITRGNYLNNARVTVEGTALTSLTNSFGEYRISGVPAGEVRVTAFYSGLAPVSATVVVVPDGNVIQNLDLTSNAPEDIITLDAMTVTSSREMSQASIATNEQRFAPNMKTVLSADEFGEQSENNVAEFLKLMPGVQIDYVEQDARNASLRGMPAHATIVTANGNQLASAASGGASRVFEFEQISINEIARVEVNKSLMPDMPAEGIGGTINLITKSAFERSRPEFKFRTYFNFNTTAIDFKKTPGPFKHETFKIKPGFDFTYINPVTKNFGITISGSHSEKYNPQWFADPTWVANPDSSIGWQNPYMSRFNAYDGPKSTQRTSGRISFDWRFAPNDTLSVGFSEQFYRALIGNRRHVVQTGSPAEITSAYVQGKLGGSNTLMNNSQNDKSGTTWTPEFKYFHNGPIWKIEAGGAYSHAGNDYMATEKGFFSGVNMTMRTPDANGVLVKPAIRLDYTADFLPEVTAVGPDGAVLDPHDMDNYSLDSVQALDRKSYDIKKTLRLNAERHFDLFVPLRVKFGGDIRQAVRDIRETTPSWNFVGPDGKTGTADNMAGLYDIYDESYSSVAPVFGQSPYRWFDTYEVYDMFLAHPEWFTQDAAALHNNLVDKSKNIVETISSAYVRLDTSFFRNRLLVSGGVRFQRYETKTESGEVNALGKYLLDDAGDIVIDPATGKPVLIPGNDPLATAENSNVERGIKRSTSLPGYYPSVNATFVIRDGLQLRASFAKSINYPQLSEILAVQTVSDPGSTSTKRLTTNLPLNPWTAKNYDLGLEYYTPHGGSFSVSFWRKEMTGFITTATYRDEAAIERLRRDGLEALIPFGYEVREKFNAGYAEMDGWEFALNHKLDPFVPDWGRGVNVFFNTSYKAAHHGSGTAGLDAVSKRSFNWGASFHRGRFAATLKWNHVQEPKRLVYSATASHAMSRTFTDADVSFRLTKRLSLFASGTNIFAVPYESYIYPPGAPEYSFRRAHRHFGVQVVAGLKGNF